MIRFLAGRWAKLSYIWEHEVNASKADLNASLSENLSAEKAAAIAKMNKETDEIEKRIAEVSAMEEKGFWECENGHETEEPAKDCYCVINRGTAIVHVSDCPLGDKVTEDGYDPASPKCQVCDKPVKFIKRSEMTEQEKFESDKERGEAEKIVASKRETAKAETENATGSKDTAKYFRSQADAGRSVADKIRRL